MNWKLMLIKIGYGMIKPLLTKKYQENKCPKCGSLMVPAIGFKDTKACVRCETKVKDN